VSCPIEECFYVRAAPPIVAPLSLFAVLLLGGNAFGIRRRQGRTYVSAFEATHAQGTAQLVALRLLVKSACVMGALFAIAASTWMSLPLLGDAVFIQMWNVPLSSRLRAIQDAAAALMTCGQLALAVVAVIAVIYTGFLIFAAGLDFLLLSFIIYAPATILFAMTRREQDRRVFSPGEVVIFAVSVVGAIVGVIALAAGWIQL